MFLNALFDLLDLTFDYLPYLVAEATVILNDCCFVLYTWYTYLIGVEEHLNGEVKRKRVDNDK